MNNASYTSYIFVVLSNAASPLTAINHFNTFTQSWETTFESVAEWSRTLILENNYDGYATMAYAAASLTKGLGATAGVGFSFTTAGEVDLKTAFNIAPSNNFTGSSADHSGQFNFDNTQRHMYWHVLMQRFGLLPIDDGTPNVGSGSRP